MNYVRCRVERRGAKKTPRLAKSAHRGYQDTGDALCWLVSVAKLGNRAPLVG